MNGEKTFLIVVGPDNEQIDRIGDDFQNYARKQNIKLSTLFLNTKAVTDRLNINMYKNNTNNCIYGITGHCP